MDQLNENSHYITDMKNNYILKEAHNNILDEINTGHNKN
jgi:hypothetical protein